MTTTTDKLAQTLHSIFRGNPHALAAARGKGFHPVEGHHDWKWIRPHVEGGQCWGFYLLSSKDECYVSCIDVDNHGGIENPEWRLDVEKLLEATEKVDSQLEPLVEISQSGEGAHLWLRSQHGVKAKTFRRLWKKIGRTAGIKLKEIYPRQDQRSGKNFGNLIRYPLWNQSRFVDVWDSWEKIEPVEALESFPAIEEEDLLSVVGGDGGAASSLVFAEDQSSELSPAIKQLITQEGTTAYKRWNLDASGLTDDSFSAVLFSFIGTLHTWGVPAHEIVPAVRALEAKAGREERPELLVRQEVDRSIENAVSRGITGGRRVQTAKDRRPLPNLAKIKQGLKTLDSVEKRDIPWIWKNRIPAEGVTLIYGQAGSFKTWFGLEVLRHVVHGLDWEDGSPCPTGRAAYLTTEDSESAIRERAELIGVDVSRVTFLDTSENPVAFQDVKHLLTLDELADCRVIVIDPCDGHLDADADTNKAADVRTALESVKNLTVGNGNSEHPVAVIAIHHTSKSTDVTKLQSAAGSRSWVAVPRTCIHVERKGGMVPRLEWTWSKANSSREHPGTVVSYFSDGFEYHTFNKEATTNNDD